MEQNNMEQLSFNSGASSKKSLINLVTYTKSERKTSTSKFKPPEIKVTQVPQEVNNTNNNTNTFKSLRSDRKRSSNGTLNSNSVKNVSPNINDPKRRPSRPSIKEQRLSNEFLPSPINTRNVYNTNNYTTDKRKSERNSKQFIQSPIPSSRIINKTKPYKIDKNKSSVFKIKITPK